MDEARPPPLVSPHLRLHTARWRKYRTQGEIDGRGRVGQIEVKRTEREGWGGGERRERRRAL